MRPIDKGATPKDAAGNDKTVTNYQSWRADLIDTVGYYCVYCNMPLSHSLQVEHVVAKKAQAGAVAGDLFAWDNMVLACGPCNRAKSNKPISAADYYLPEEHNTHLPFISIDHPKYATHAVIVSRLGMLAHQTAKANSTIQLLDLDEIDRRAKVVDLRSQKRKEAQIAVGLAKDMFDSIKVLPPQAQDDGAKGIATWAKGIGFFSLWYEAFQHEPLVMKWLTDNSIIKGTAANCFDAANGYQPVPRNPADLHDPI